MGCSPLGQMVSTVFGKCGGRERRRASKVMIVSPPPSYLYARPRTVVKSVSFSNDNPIIIIPPNQNQQPAETPPMPPANQSTGTHVAAEGAEPVRVRFAGGARPKDAGPPPSGAAHPEPVTAQRGAPHGYVMSPLPRWEERARRREYFSGEYHYYPTPIREGIYEIATDANRLTTIFSEENPNACSIV